MVAGEKSPYSVALFDTFQTVPKDIWNDIAPWDNIFMQSPYLEIVESKNAGGMDFQYAIMFEENRAVGIGYFQIVDFQGEELKAYVPANTFSGTLYTITSKLQRFLDSALNRISWKLLVSGNIFMTGEHGFYFREDIDQPEGLELVRLTMKQIVKERKDDKINAYLMMNLYEFETEGDYILKNHSFRKISTDSDMILRVDSSWESYNDYIADMSSKYRVRAKKVYKNSADLIVKELDCESLETHKSRIEELYLNVARKANFNLGYLTGDYFCELKRQLGKNYKVFAYFEPASDDHTEGRMVGFITSFLQTSGLEVHYVGLEYSVQNKYKLFNRILFDNVDLAIKHRVKRVHYGRTAPEIKSTVGAVPEEMYSYLKHTGFLYNLLIKPLSSYIKPQEWIQRSPFKEKAAVQEEVSA